MNKLRNILMVVTGVCIIAFILLFPRLFSGGIYITIGLICVIVSTICIFWISRTCDECGHWLKFVGTENYSSYSYQSTKPFDVKNSSGTKVGSIDMPVTETEITYDKRFICTNCGKIVIKESS